MDFDDAIRAHVNWKIRLRTYIANPDGTLDASVIERDDQCNLGKWIYDGGAIHKNLVEYEQLRSEHAQFHKCAAEILRKADQGALAEARTLMQPTSEYAWLSSSIVARIQALRRKVA